MELCSLLGIYLGPNYGGGREDNGDLLPCLYWKFLDIHGQVWVSFLWDHCSFLLGPCGHKVLSVPFKSPFPSLVLAALSSVSVQSLSHVRLFATP